MLCSADQSIVHRDPNLPGLATLLDDQAMVALLQAQGLGVEAVTSTYLRYKPHTSCLVAYKVILNRQTHWAYGKVFPLKQTNKLAKYQRLGPGAPAQGLRPLVLHELGLAIAPFPCDRALPHIAPLMATPQPKLLHRLLPNPPVGPLALHVLNYKPERRYVAQISAAPTDPCRWVIKAYTAADFPKAHSNSHSVQSRDVLQVIPPAGCSRDDQMLAFPWCGDCPLIDLLTVVPLPTLNRILEAVGVALAELQGQTIQAAQPMSCTAEALDLMSLVSDLCYLCPTLSKPIKAVSHTIAHGLVQQPQQWRTTHGDFKPDQILVSPPGLWSSLDGSPSLFPESLAITVLDLDRAVLGHPARDLGSFLAQLEYQALRGRLAEDRCQVAAQALLKGYSRLGDRVSPESLRLYTTLHLVKLLADPFRYRAPDWPTGMEKLLHRIEQVLQPGRGDTEIG
jgi:hypothetical protein